jgi:hypothetical protein
VLLVELDVEEALEERGEAERGVPEQLRGDAGVDGSSSSAPSPGGAPIGSGSMTACRLRVDSCSR